MGGWTEGGKGERGSERIGRREGRGSEGGGRREGRGEGGGKEGREGGGMIG